MRLQSVTVLTEATSRSQIGIVFCRGAGGVLVGRVGVTHVDGVQVSKGVLKKEGLMHLILAPQEHELLLWAVKGTISDLGTEIRHTDNRAMREDLQKRKRILSVVHARLGFTA